MNRDVIDSSQIRRAEIGVLENVDELIAPRRTENVLTFRTIKSDIQRFRPIVQLQASWDEVNTSQSQDTETLACGLTLQAGKLHDGLLGHCKSLSLKDVDSYKIQSACGISSLALFCKVQVPRIDIKYPSKGSAQGVHRSLEPSVRRTGACDGELG